jgi:hypothetical protein
MQRFAPSLTVKDPKLAGALAAVGVPPDPRGFEDSFTHDGRRFSCWHFLSQTIDGADQTRALVAAWLNPEEWNRAHPTHRFAYVMIAYKNTEILLKRARNREPYFILQQGSSVAVVNPSAAQGDQDVILQKIGI